MVLASKTIAELNIIFEHTSYLVTQCSLVVLDNLAQDFRKDFLWVCNSCWENKT